MKMLVIYIYMIPSAKIIILKLSNFLIFLVKNILRYWFHCFILFLFLKKRRPRLTKIFKSSHHKLKIKMISLKDQLLNEYYKIHKIKIQV